MQPAVCERSGAGPRTCNNISRWLSTWKNIGARNQVRLSKWLGACKRARVLVVVSRSLERIYARRASNHEAARDPTVWDRPLLGAVIGGFLGRKFARLALLGRRGRAREKRG